MGGKSGSSSGGGGITGASLAAAGIEGVSPEGLKRAWQNTFGQELKSVKEVQALVGASALTNPNIYVTTGYQKINVSVTAQGVSLSRSYSPGAVKHETLFVSKDRQGGGLGKRVLKEQVSSYQRLGIEKISLQATEAGRYVWPRYGFKVDKSDMATYRKGFNRWLKEQGIPAKRVSSVQQIANARYGGRKIGKEYLLSKDAPNMTHMTHTTKGPATRRTRHHRVFEQRLAHRRKSHPVRMAFPRAFGPVLGKEFRTCQSTKQPWFPRRSSVRATSPTTRGRIRKRRGRRGSCE